MSATDFSFWYNNCGFNCLQFHMLPYLKRAIVGSLNKTMIFLKLNLISYVMAFKISLTNCSHVSTVRFFHYKVFGTNWDMNRTKTFSCQLEITKFGFYSVTISYPINDIRSTQKIWDKINFSIMYKEVQKKLARNWFKILQDVICNEIEILEKRSTKFTAKNWNKSSPLSRKWKFVNFSPLRNQVSHVFMLK